MDNAAPPPSPLAAAPPPSPSRRLTPLRIVGLVLACVGVGSGLALLRRPADALLALTVGSLAASLAGAWLLARGAKPVVAWTGAGVGLGLGVLLLATGLLPFAWPALGLGGGALCAWGYARRERAAGFSAALLAVAWAVSAAAALLRSVHGRGQEWILLQGLGSLVVCAALLALLRRRTDAPRIVRLAAVVLGAGGVLLPYLALTATALGR